jgi:hypothetical protein
MLLFVVLASCAKSEHVGKYNVTSISGIGNISEIYEYNYIELKKNGDYYQTNKVKGTDTVFEQTGEWEVDGETITIITKSGSQKITETGTIKDGKITLTAQIGGSTLTVVWEKE